MLSLFVRLLAFGFVGKKQLTFEGIADDIRFEAHLTQQAQPFGTREQPTNVLLMLDLGALIALTQEINVIGTVLCILIVWIVHPFQIA